MPRERVTGLKETLGIVEDDVTPGRVRCSLVLGDQHRNIQGVIHGSVVMAVLDTAMGHSLDAMLEATEFCSTTQFSLQFIRAARAGETLRAEGVVTRKGRRIAYLEGTCTNEAGETIARAQGTWYIGTLRTPPTS